MAKNKVHISDDLIQDLKKYGTAVCVSLATQVRDEMYQEAQFAIDSFYEDYTPLYYRRHYYNFKDNSFVKYYKNPHNSIVRGGVELTPYALDDIYRRKNKERPDKEYIFNLVYTGYHGYAQSFPHNVVNIPPKMNPSPYKMLIKKRQYLIDNISDYQNVAINKASKGTYKTLLV